MRLFYRKYCFSAPLLLLGIALVKIHLRIRSVSAHRDSNTVLLTRRSLERAGSVHGLASERMPSPCNLPFSESDPWQAPTDGLEAGQRSRLYTREHNDETIPNPEVKIASQIEETHIFGAIENVRTCSISIGSLPAGWRQSAPAPKDRPRK